MTAVGFFSLFSTIANGNFDEPKRIGCFSYGSGCCSEFFSGLINTDANKNIQDFNFEEKLNNRYKLKIDEYEELLRASNAVKFGTRNVVIDMDFLKHARENNSKTKRLFLKEIKEYHREYEWI